MASHVIKRGIFYDDITSTMEKLLSATKTTNDSIIPLSYDTLKDAFIHMGGNISDFPNLEKQTVALEIERRWDKYIIKEGARKTAYLGGGPRLEQRW